jgi:hypothetical protein
LAMRRGADEEGMDRILPSSHALRKYVNGNKVLAAGRR